MTPGSEKWKALYEFDTPVVHIDKTHGHDQAGGTSAKARKLMHRFTDAELESAMDEVEQQK
ncbi:hypothetical protein LTR85_003441 [Meristemomyces frigidus]|nr:hypothetical protein LTR85_003441 [Meristemomyces frigidus]